MRITLIIDGIMRDFHLPEKIKGQVWINKSDYDEKLLIVEATDGRWALTERRDYTRLMNVTHYADKASGSVEVISDGKLFLQGKQLVVFQVIPSGIKGFLLIVDEEIKNGFFEHYSLNRDREIQIGKDSGCEICYRNSYVSGHHATLTHNGEEWVLSSSGRNGTFLNGRLIELEKVSPGDTIRILDLIIVIGFDEVAINNPDNSVRVSLDMAVAPEPEAADKEEVEGETYYYRLPRFKKSIETFELKIDPPPADQVGDEMPLLMTIGPSATMGLTSLVTGVYSVSRAINTGNWTSAIPSMVMCIGMLLGSVLWPIISKNYTRKQKEKKERIRQTKYTKYLKECKRAVAAETKRQRDILLENYPSTDTCLNMVLTCSDTLWQRNNKQNDFLYIKLGTGTLKLDADIKYQERRFSISEDNLENEMFEFCESEKVIDYAPITFSLREHFLTAIVATEAELENYIKGLLVQLLYSYGYDELKLVFIMDEAQYQRFSYVRWLPHTWNEQHSFRFIATNAEETKSLSRYLDSLLDDENDEKEEELKSPNYIIFALNRDLALRTSVLKRIYASKNRHNISVISCVGELNQVPKDMQAVIRIRNGEGSVVYKSDDSAENILFRDDVSTKKDIEQFAIILANTFLDMDDDGKNLPKTYQFMKMMEAGSLKDLNIINRWRENDPTTSLKAQIGIDSLGDLIYLDLHQKAHGPHGLVAGMTGSGKSEFIITYILSLAVNYHPYEVAFVLIDYKGGGMAKTFEKLPHTVGIITNLDGSAIQRSLMSIESELKVREEIFAETSKRLGESNIDIYKYQKYYREGKVSRPLPHLFVISDEFAELKAQQPEFMQQLISTARIGRSLGVHLILATQKPAGVVDDQIWSNSRFRICLKVQDRNDSMDMLKRPEAANLIETGRFYMQVGYNEMFQLGQSAWAGADYVEGEDKTAEGELTVINRLGIPIMIGRVKTAKVRKAEKQVDKIVSYIGEIAKEEHLQQIRLWEEPLSEHPLVDELEKKYQYKAKKNVLKPLVGEVDIPSAQKKDALYIPLSDMGNVLVYGAAEGGKTTFLHALIYSLIRHHAPNEINLYILDFYTEILGCYREAPQVADVVYAFDKDKIRRLFKLLMADVKERRAKLGQYGGSYKIYQEQNDDMPAKIVIIHNYGIFRELYQDEGEQLDYLAREGVKYGIYFVLTAAGYGAIRMSMLQNFKLIYALQLNDPSDYSTILGKTGGLIPAAFKGRGLYRNESINEFQTAYISKDDVPMAAIGALVEVLKESVEMPEGHTKSLDTLPNHLSKAYFVEKGAEITDTHWPIAVDVTNDEIVYQSCDEQNIHMIYSEGNQYRAFCRGLLGMVPDNKKLIVIDSTGDLSGVKIGNGRHATTYKEIEAVILELFDLVLKRNNDWKDMGMPGELPESYEPVYVMITGLASLMDAIPDDQLLERLKLILLKTQTVFRIYLYVADSSKTVLYERQDWYTSQCKNKTIIWIGPGYLSQRRAYARVDLPKEYDRDAANQGACVADGEVRFVQLLEG